MYRTFSLVVLRLVVALVETHKSEVIHNIELSHRT